MTRWARTERSTGSQKRSEEAASSWSEIKATLNRKSFKHQNPDDLEDDQDEVQGTSDEEAPGDEDEKLDVPRPPDDVEQSNCKSDEDDPSLLEMVQGLSAPSPSNDVNEEIDVNLQDLVKEVQPRKPRKSYEDEEDKIDGILKGDVERTKVYFEGSWIPVMRKDELMGLRRRLMKQGMPRDQIEEIIRKERRKDERKSKVEKKNVCFNCRQTGHFLSDCPEVSEKGLTGGICYKCGDGDHTSKSCRAKPGLGGASFPMAQCFVCGEPGHIARECPDNPRGLYPHGGSCRLCGDVTHFARDCPKFHGKKNSFQGNRLQSTRKRPWDGDSARHPAKVVKF